MREIIHLQVGQCGNQVGEKFWENILSEHGLDERGTHTEKSSLDLQKIDVFFNSRSDGRYAPRAVLIDSEPCVIESLSSGKLRDLFSPANTVMRENGAGSNWAKGYYLLGAELLEPTMDVIRKEAEGCNSIQGIQMSQSLGGGTGSGFGSLLLETVREEFPDRIISSFAIFPSSDISNNVVEPYNAILATSALIESTDAVHVLDNKALAQITTGILKQKNPTFEDYNILISQAMAGTTCSLRFPGQLNSDLRKLCVNLTPFPRLHFFASSTAPLISMDEAIVKSTVALLTSQMFNPRYLMCRCGIDVGRFLTASVMFRGKVPMRDVDEQIRLIQQKQSSNFVAWIPNNIKKCICDVPPTGKTLSATFLGNSTGTQSLMADLKDQFSVMLKRQAFLHWYTQEGLDEDQFFEAEDNVHCLINEYKQYENGSTTEDGSTADSEVLFND